MCAITGSVPFRAGTFPGRSGAGPGYVQVHISVNVSVHVFVHPRVLVHGREGTPRGRRLGARPSRGTAR